MSRIRVLLVASLLPVLLPAQAEPQCLRSANIMRCELPRYSLANHGTWTYMRGYDSASQRSWSQTSQRFGSRTLVTGVAADGEVWFMFSRRLGWNQRGKLSSSSGIQHAIDCNRLRGC